MINKLLPTTIIGSYPKPKWFTKVKSIHEKGKFGEEKMEEAENDACKVIIDEHEICGIDVLNDGEMRRTEMVEHFASKIPGFKFYGPVRVWGNNYFNKPSVTRELKDPGPMLVDEFKFIKKHSDENNYIKMPITGPYTIADWSFNEIYSRKELIMRLADIINSEIKRLADAGVKCIQLDEPALSTHPSEVDLVKEATSKVFDNVKLDKKIIHACYGKFDQIYPEILDFEVDQFSLEFANNNFEFLDIFKENEFTKELGLGCIDVHKSEVESVSDIENNINRGLNIVPPEKLWINPDCGMKLLPRKSAYLKLKNMVKATNIVREEIE